MRDAQFRRPVESIVRRAVMGPKPQWQDLFLAPAYSAEASFEDEPLEEPAVDWSQMSLLPQRRRPAGRRVNGRAA
ncbi:hypothetical protein ACIBAC_42780 [Streptomyces sp. NPDC051362]|uniref:hypothetical protein n=1 Tax=Streptomyces sp. NPDC051362 TaxID=3365651 RepID=UPI0037AB4665